MKIRIITDSTADLPDSIKDQPYILPLTVRFGDKEYRDGVDITHAGPGAVAVAFFSAVK